MTGHNDSSTLFQSAPEDFVYFHYLSGYGFRLLMILDYYLLVGYEIESVAVNL